MWLWVGLPDLSISVTTDPRGWIPGILCDQALDKHVKLQDLQVWTSERAQQEKGLAAKPGYLSSIPRTHMVEGENRLSQVVL